MSPSSRNQLCLLAKFPQIYFICGSCPQNSQLCYTFTAWLSFPFPLTSSGSRTACNWFPFTLRLCSFSVETGSTQPATVIAGDRWRVSCFTWTHHCDSHLLLQVQVSVTSLWVQADGTSSSVWLIFWGSDTLHLRKFGLCKKTLVSKFSFYLFFFRPIIWVLGTIKSTYSTMCSSPHQPICQRFTTTLHWENTVNCNTEM